MSEDTGESKSEDATESKLSRQRDKGQFAKSQLFSDLSKYCIGIATIWIYYILIIESQAQLFSSVSILIANPDKFLSSIDIISFSRYSELLIIGFMCLMVIISLLTHGLYSKGFPFSFELVSPKFNNLSPAKGIKRMFGRRNQLEAWTGIVRMTLWLSYAIIIIYTLHYSVVATLTCGLGCSAAAAHDLMKLLLGGSVVVCIVAILADIPIQKSIFMKEMKMTKSELTRDNKESYGDPNVKSAQRQIGKENTTEDAARQMERDGGIMTSHKELSDQSFVVTGNTSVIAIRLALEEDYPVPVIVASSPYSHSANLLSQASSRGIKIYERPGLADMIGHKYPAGVILDEKYFSELIALLKDEKIV